MSTGAVTGLRIDHPDGLYLPREYFVKLQQRSAKALGIGLPRDGRAIYMVAEKILTGSETLRKEWPVHGTTGYDFANQLTQLLVESSAETAITKTFHRFIGHSDSFWAFALREKTSGDEACPGERRRCFRKLARSFVRAKQMVSRFYARSAVARRAGNNCVLSGLPNLRRARSAGNGRGSANRRARHRRSQTPQPGNGGIDLQFFVRRAVASFPPGSRCRRTRCACAISF